MHIAQHFRNLWLVGLLWLFPSILLPSEQGYYVETPQGQFHVPANPLFLATPPSPPLIRHTFFDPLSVIPSSYWTQAQSLCASSKKHDLCRIWKAQQLLRSKQYEALTTHVKMAFPLMTDTGLQRVLIILQAVSFKESSDWEALESWMESHQPKFLSFPDELMALFLLLGKSYLEQEKPNELQSLVEIVEDSLFHHKEMPKLLVYSIVTHLNSKNKRAAQQLFQLLQRRGVENQAILLEAQAMVSIHRLDVNLALQQISALGDPVIRSEYRKILRYQILQSNWETSEKSKWMEQLSHGGALDLWWIAAWYESIQSFEQAQRWYEKAILLSSLPQHHQYEAQLRYGVLLLKNNDIVKAQKTLKQATLFAYEEQQRKEAFFWYAVALIQTDLRKVPLVLRQVSESHRALEQFFLKAYLYEQEGRWQVLSDLVRPLVQHPEASIQNKALHYWIQSLFHQRQFAKLVEEVHSLRLLEYTSLEQEFIREYVYKSLILLNKNNYLLRLVSDWYQGERNAQWGIKKLELLYQTQSYQRAILWAEVLVLDFPELKKDAQFLKLLANVMSEIVNSEIDISKEKIEWALVLHEKHWEVLKTKELQQQHLEWFLKISTFWEDLHRLEKHLDLMMSCCDSRMLRWRYQAEVFYAQKKYEQALAYFWSVYHLQGSLENSEQFDVLERIIYSLAALSLKDEALKVYGLLEQQFSELGYTQKMTQLRSILP